MSVRDLRLCTYDNQHRWDGLGRRRALRRVGRDPETGDTLSQLEMQAPDVPKLQEDPVKQILVRETILEL